jgi:hypothetical protein
VEGILDFSFFVQTGIDGERLYFIKIQVEIECITIKWGGIE